MHDTIEPAILYFGTPVALVSTMKEDGSPKLAPMSSARSLDGGRCWLRCQQQDAAEHAAHGRVRLAARISEELYRRVVVPASAMIAFTAIYWTIVRLGL